MLKAIELFDAPRARNRSSPQDDLARNVIDYVAQGPITLGQRTPSQDDPNDPDYCPNQDYAAQFCLRRRWSMSTLSRIVQLADREMSERSIKAQYKRYHRNMLPRFRRCLAGNNPSRLRQAVNEYVIEQVKKRREEQKSVHDNMMRSWGRRKAAEIGLTSF